MSTDLERQVTLMPCSRLPSEYPCDHYTGKHTVCGATGLRWRTLSLECECCDKGEVCLTYTDTGNYAKTIKCPDCHGSGQVPDASLRKLVDCFFDIDLQPRFCKMNDGSVRFDLYNSQGEPVTNG